MRYRLSFVPWIVVLLLVLTGESFGHRHKTRSISEAQAQQLLGSVQMVELSFDDVSGAAVSYAHNTQFIVDGSGSMGWAPGTEEDPPDCKADRRFKIKMDILKWAIPEALVHIPETDHLGLYVFDRRGQRQVVPLGANNRTEFLVEIKRMKPKHRTPLAEAIRVSVDLLVEKMKIQLGKGRYRIVIFTDGQADGIIDAVLYATKYGIPIYTVGLCTGQNHVLRHLSASYRNASNPEELRSGFADTFAEMNSFETD